MNGFFTAKRVILSPDYGRLLENLVFVELIRRGFASNKDLFFVVTENGYEVDFLVRSQGINQELIQVCWAMQQQKTRERELRALIEAARSLNIDKLRILTFSEIEIIEEKNFTIEVQTVSNWLLASS